MPAFGLAYLFGEDQLFTIYFLLFRGVVYDAPLEPTARKN